MKIIYCIGSLAKAGGVERVLINKANYLADVAGFHITILIAKQNNLAICYPISQKVKIIDVAIDVSSSMFSRIPVLGFYNNIRQLKKVYQSIVNELKPNIIINVERGYEDFIIHSFSPMISNVRESHLSMAAVKIKDNNSVSFFESIKKKYFTYLYAKQLLKYDKVVLLTKQDAKDRQLINGDVVIPNVISSFGICPKYDINSRKVISVGRLDLYKNFKDQIIVWKEVVKVHPRWTLHIFGDGSEKENLQQLIQSLSLEKNVFLEGVSPKIQDQYATSSFFIFTSVAEGFGMVLVEAMQMGLPVISYDCPCGPSDIIEEGIDGYLVDLFDLKILEKRILHLIENKDLRENMSLLAQKKSKSYLPENIMPHWIALFKKMSNGK